MVTTKKKGSYIERLLTSRLCVMVEYLKLTNVRVYLALCFSTSTRECVALEGVLVYTIMKYRKNENTTIDNRAQKRNNYLCHLAQLMNRFNQDASRHAMESKRSFV